MKDMCVQLLHMLWHGVCRLRGCARGRGELGCSSRHKVEQVRKDMRFRAQENLWEMRSGGAKVPDVDELEPESSETREEGQGYRDC